jgi:hypothetical protein
MSRIGKQQLAARTLVSRALFLAIVLALTITLSVGPAQAKGNVVISNLTEEVWLFYYVPCAAGGAGDYVLLSGPLHMQFIIAMDGRGGFHEEFLYQTMGLSGTGTSGETYHVTDQARSTYNGRVGLEETIINTLRVIGEGSASDFLVQYSMHMTVHEDGTVSANVFNYNYQCKPASYP